MIKEGHARGSAVGQAADNRDGGWVDLVKCRPRSRIDLRVGRGIRPLQVRRVSEILQRKIRLVADLVALYRHVWELRMLGPEASASAVALRKRTDVLGH